MIVNFEIAIGLTIDPGKNHVSIIARLEDLVENAIETARQDDKLTDEADHNTIINWIDVEKKA